ncbi:CDP-alcohol phosphatidyltransferase family protein [Acrocarpospora catenulata]|uniref:CDP-alcohol phosphatidyltransferase family protein n=1 Tax=Acrocarpospora catenulata TaxID=2836182 RepID=UPI001BDB5F05|nr:CDP-alcohol phosphatidyltransferase family protein [Acrocarpospora catenulata]
MGDRRPDAVAVVLATTPASGLTCATRTEGRTEGALEREGAGGTRTESAEATLLDRLTDQLVALPVGDLRVVSDVGLPAALREVAAVARAAEAPVAVLAGDVVAHTEALALLLEHPARSTGALVGNGAPDPPHAPVRVEHGRVVAAGNSFHQVHAPNATFRGVFQVAEDQAKNLADIADELAALAERQALGEVSEAEAPDLLLAGLVRSGVPVRAARLGEVRRRTTAGVAADADIGLRCTRVTGQAEADLALRRLAEVDEERVRMASSIKADDGFFATYLVSTWSPHLVRLAARIGLAPNSVTGISLGLAALAAVWFSAGDRQGMVAGAAALYLSFVLDCVDGQLARYTRRFSPLGAWLDATFDRAKEFLVYLGLAIGYPGDVWPLAVAAMLLQAVRHMIDFAYAGAVTDAAQAGSAWAPPQHSLAVAMDSARTVAAVQRENTIVQLAERLDGGTVSRWIKKIIVLPIGERMALIAVTAALFDARITFLALLVWGGVAALYSITGRIARSLA